MARGMPGRVRSLPKGGGNAARSALRPGSGTASGGPGVIRSVAGGAIRQANISVPQARGGTFKPPGRGSAPAASAAAPGLRGGQPGARMGIQGRTPTQGASKFPSAGQISNRGLGSPGIASRSGGPSTGGLGGRGGGRGTTSGPAGSLTGTTTGTNPSGTY